MKSKLPLIILLVAIFLFYSPLLFLNFIQDDFFCLLISKTNNLKDFFVFFTPEHSFITSHYTFYRPLTTQFYFGVMQKIFGLQPFFFHFASLLVHLLNVFLVYKLAKLFFPKAGRLLPLLSAFIYGSSQNHIVAIGWASNMQELGVTTFILLSTIFYRKNFIFYSLIFFILALLSKETAITLPLLLFFINPKPKKLIPFGLILAYYLFVHFIKFRFTETENYQLIVNFQALNTLKWYIWWGIGLPEMFMDYIGPRFSIVPNLWRFFFKESVAIFSLFGLLSLTLITSAITKIKKFSFFFLAFYLIFLLPIIFFPQNKYPYHQTTALAGFSIFLACFLASSKKYLIVSFVLFFGLLQIFSRNLTLQTNPMIQRSKLVTQNLDIFRKQYPTLPENSIIYIKNDPNYPKINDIWGGTAKQLSIAVSREDSFKLYYGDSVRVFFEGKDPTPKNFSVEFTATIQK